MNKLLILTLVFMTCALGVNGQQKAESIKLDLFSKIPSQIDGCSGLYTYDTTPLKKMQYLIATDLQELAFIQVNGRQVTLKLTARKELPKDTYRSIYKGSGYTVVLTTKTIKRTGDEVFLDGGTIEVTLGQSKATIKIHGESGC